MSLDICNVADNIIENNASTLYNIAKNNDLPLKLIVDIFSSYIENSKDIKNSKSLFWEETEKIHLIPKKRKRNNNIVPHDCDRCIARIWNNGFGGQCTRKKQNGKHCLSHQKKLNYGNITDKLPDSFKHSDKQGETFYNGYKKIINFYIPIKTNLIRYKKENYYWDPESNCLYSTEQGNKYIGILCKKGNTHYIKKTENKLEDNDNQDSDIE